MALWQVRPYQHIVDEIPQSVWHLSNGEETSIKSGCLEVVLMEATGMIVVVVVVVVEELTEEEKTSGGKICIFTASQIYSNR